MLSDIISTSLKIAGFTFFSAIVWYLTGKNVEFSIFVGVLLWGFIWTARCVSDYVHFHMLPKSYTENDVFLAAMRLKEFEANSKTEFHPIESLYDLFTPNETNRENKKIAAKYFGSIYSFILGGYTGQPKDFDRYLKDVLYSAVSPRSAARTVYGSVLRLRKRTNQDFYEGFNEINISLKGQRTQEK